MPSRSGKTTITSAERLQLIGLIALADRHTKMLDEIRMAAADIVDERDRNGAVEKYGHISDTLDGGRDLDEALRLLGITVVDAPPAEPRT